MPEVGPLWQIAEFNAYYYASFWIAPCLVGIGAVSRGTRTFVAMLVAAALTTLALSWYAQGQMWEMRALVANNIVEKRILEVHAMNPIRYSMLYACGQTLRIVVIWGLGAVAFRFLRSWFESSRPEVTETPFEAMN